MFYIGLDLGQKQDYTAIAIVEKPDARRGFQAPFQLLVRRVQRVALGIAECGRAEEGFDLRIAVGAGEGRTADRAADERSGVAGAGTDRSAGRARRSGDRAGAGLLEGAAEDDRIWPGTAVVRRFLHGRKKPQTLQRFSVY
jgi:hypothetical protein